MPALSPQPAPVTRRPADYAEPIGGLLARARLARGLSQGRLAEELCAAAGRFTVTRHEVSRWERGARVPGGYWLHWLAVVLRVPTDELEAAAAVVRARRAAAHSVPPRPPRSVSLPKGPPYLPAPAPRSPRPPAPGPHTLADRLWDLRRMDDLVGGADLADVVERELRAALALLRDRPARPLLDIGAQLAQLAGWTAADAGRIRAARRAYRIGLSLADAAGDRAFGAYLLGCLSHLLAPRDPARALRVAHAAYDRARLAAPAGVRVLLLHRIAFAAALAGRRRTSEQALATAERLADRQATHREPGWLYWLDEAELAGLTGRCFAALRRPLRAEPLLRLSLNRPGAAHPRTAALDAGWLAQTYLDAGEVEQACQAARAALVAAVRSGSPRAAARALAPAARLTRPCTGRPGRDYARLLAAARPYLPVATRRAGPAGRAGRAAASVHA